MGAINYDDLGDNLLGYYDHRTDAIWINQRSSERQQKCTLAHERIHARDKDKPIADPWLDGKRERMVEREAARSLVNVEDLSEAIKWAQDSYTLCSLLDVDLPLLQARLDTLTANERDYLDQIARNRDA